MVIRINQEWAGLTVKKVLLDRLGFSRGAVTSLKQKPDGILVDGEHKTVRWVLREGEELSLHVSDTEPSPRIRPSEGPIDILYEDEDLLAVNKPPNMAVHPSKKLQDDTLAGRILYHRYPMVFRAAGRLDKDTSGVVISAKSRVMAGRFFDLIRNHGIHKEYLVLTESHLIPPPYGEIRLCIRRHPESYVTRVCFEADGTELPTETALTKFRLVCSRPPYHLFLASPVTGRTHQLRVHFSSIGFPLVGDTLYGKESELMGRQALHALRLTFPHPATGETLRIQAPLHEDYQKALVRAFGEEIPLPDAAYLQKTVEKDETMEKIQSFTVDHTKLLPGLYISREDGDVTTFDLRTRRPNYGDYMDHSTMHSVEHLLATFLRNGPQREKILYFGPMGCQTGFYLLVRDLDPDSVRAELIRALEAVEEYEGEMPGNSAVECGNYQSLSMEAGKAECRRYRSVLEQQKGDYTYEI